MRACCAFRARGGGRPPRSSLRTWPPPRRPPQPPPPPPPRRAPAGVEHAALLLGGGAPRRKVRLSPSESWRPPTASANGRGRSDRLHLQATWQSYVVHSGSVAMGVARRAHSTTHAPSCSAAPQSAVMHPRFSIELIGSFSARLVAKQWVHVANIGTGLRSR